MYVSFGNKYHHSATNLTSDIISAGTNLKLIGTAGSGVDNIDVKAATRRNIVVMNTPSGNITSTVELTLSLVVALARNIPRAYSSMKAMQWDRKIVGTELNGKTFGVIGLGKVGLEVSIRAAAFGMEVVAFDPVMSDEIAASYGVKKVSLKTLFESSDFITVHTPLTKDTKNLISAATLKSCKEGVYIINCSRGGIVNEQDLLVALKSGKVAGAALDVFAKEPPTEESKELLSHPNLICTPHLGASTEEVQVKSAEAIANQFNDVFKGLETVGIVNAPFVSLSHKKYMKPYIDLGEAIGSLQAQLAPESLSAVNISVRGSDIESQTAQQLLSNAVLKGLLSKAKGLKFDQKVSLINASLFSTEAGLSVDISISDARNRVLKNYVSVELKSENHNYTRTILGTVANGEPIIASMDSWKSFPAFKPEGNILFFNNIDKPGAVNGVLRVLKEHGINVASLGVGRQSKHQRALAMLVTDDKLNDKILDELGDLGTLENIKTVSFP